MVVTWSCLCTLFRPRGGGGGGGGGLKFSRGLLKIRNRAAAVTGPQRHLAALGLGDSSLYNSPRHTADKSFKINQLVYYCCSVDSGQGWGLWLRSWLVVRVSRIAFGVKRVRLFSERLCIYTF